MKNNYTFLNVTAPRKQVEGGLMPELFPPESSFPWFAVGGISQIFMTQRFISGCYFSFKLLVKLLPYFGK